MIQKNANIFFFQNHFKIYDFYIQQINQIAIFIHCILIQKIHYKKFWVWKNDNF